MVKKLSSIVLVFSLALNLAFVGVWGYHEFYLEPGMRQKPFRRQRRGFARRDDDEHHKRHDGEDHDGRRGRLDVEPERRKAIRRARHKLMRKMKDIGRRIGQRREELFELLMKPEPDRANIREKVKKLNETRAELAWATVEHILELKKVLPREEQQRLLKKIRERAHGRGKGPHGFRGGRRKGPRSHRECGGDEEERRRDAPPSRDSHGPK